DAIGHGGNDVEAPRIEPGDLASRWAVRWHDERLDVDGQRPATGQDDTRGATGLLSVATGPGGWLGLHQASRRHLEPRHLSLRPVAILPPHQDPKAGAGITLERQHRVHRVLQRAGAGGT